jgi:hypothetical protein
VAKKEVPEHIHNAKPKEKDVVLVKFYLVGETHTW